MPKSIVTMRDVAMAAGVSTMTVSRALRPNSAVSAETRNKILKVVEDLNYVPDQVAGSLSSKRSGFVGILVPSLNNLHFAETVQALTVELEKSGHDILLGHTGYAMEREEQLVETMLRRRPEAMILSYDGHSSRTVALLKAAAIPVVQLWERPETPIQHTIGFSNEDAAYEMTRKLIACGYQKLTFLGEAGWSWTRGAARRRGFARAVDDAGLDSRRIIETGTPPISIDDGAAALGILNDRFPDTDCVFCVSDLPAFGLLSAMKTNGLQVPNDIGVAGFGNFEVSRFSSPSISTVKVESKKVGALAGRLIGDLLEHRNSGPDAVRIHVEATPVLRESTNTPPSH